MIPFPPFEPDKSPFNPSASNNTLNVLPAADGKKPMSSLVEISEALGDECLGAVSIESSDDTLTIIAGTRTNLYKLNTSVNPNTWTNISKSTDAYSVPTNDRWQFALFGDNLIACSLGDVPQTYDIETPAAFADLANAPTARTVWVAGDFLVFASLTGAPNKMAWSGLNDSTFWTYGERGSDEQLFPDGGEILAGFGSQRGAVVMQRDKMRYMSFSPNSSYTFTFSEANSVRGVLSQFAVANLGPEQFFYLSNDGFFAGIEGRSIGAERVDSWFFETVDTNYLYDVRAVVDPFEKIVWWIFQTVDGSRRLLGYDWQLDQWCLSDQNISEAVALLTSGTTWDGLANSYASIDDVNVAFDSRLFKGGLPTFAAFTTDNKLAFFAGTSKAATIQTAQMELVSGQRSFLNGGRVHTDATVYTVTEGTAEYHGGDITEKTAVSPSVRSGHVPLRSAGRLHQLTINIPAGEDWNIATGISLKYLPEGSQ